MQSPFIPLSFPPIELQYYKDKENYYYFDRFRKKKLILTKEEWVRQHVAHFLMQTFYFPISSLALEKMFVLGKKRFRSDILAYAPQTQPFLLVECKAPEIKLDKKHLDQLVEYNFVLEIPFLLLTNGLEKFYYKYEPQNKNYLPSAPPPQIWFPKFGEAPKPK